MDVLRQDIVFALRLLRRDRAYTAAVVLTLALCLGANGAIFAVVRAYSCCQSHLLPITS